MKAAHPAYEMQKFTKPAKSWFFLRPDALGGSRAGTGHCRLCADRLR